MKKHQIKRKKAFTLVELIVVITILAILSTLGYIGFSNFIKDARDGNRIMTLKNIENGLKLNYIKTNKYPNPEGEIIEGEINGKKLLKVGEFGKDNARVININNNIVDPLTKQNYKYGTDARNKYYELATVMEGNITYKSLINQTYANEEYKAKVIGNYPGYIKFSSGSELWIANIPGIILNNTGSVDLLSDEVYYVVDKQQNLPYKIKEDTQIQKIQGNELIKQLTNSQTSTLTGVNITGITQENFNSYFTQELLESFNINKVDKTNEQILIESVKQIVLGSSTTQYNSCATPPNYTDATFIVGTPNKQNQEWQSINENAGCYWTCGLGKVLLGNECVTESCGGETPDGTIKVVNASHPYGGTWHYSETSGACTYACGENYTENGGECEPSTRANQACTGLIGNAVWNSVSQITQTWSGSLSEWTPTLTGSYNETTSTTECRYTCSEGYIYDTETSTCKQNKQYSLMFDSASGQYLSRTPTTAGNRKTWTYSTWIKRGKIGGAVYNKIFTAYSGVNDASNYFDFQLGADSISWSLWSTYSGYTTNLFRDASSWYHIVLSVDTTKDTPSERVKLYVNNDLITSYSPAATYPVKDLNTAVNFISAPKRIGSASWTSAPFDGYMSDINFVDGQALSPSAFGQIDSTTGQRVPKKYTGTYGTNGFYLDFADGATTDGNNVGLGKDISGNGNYWKTNGITHYANNQMLDHPTNNFATLNPLANTQTLSSGNLKAYGASTTATHGSMAISPNVPTYFEITNISQSHANLAFGGGIVGTEVSPGVNYQVNVTQRIAGFYASNYQYIMRDNGTNFLAQASALLSNDIIQIAVNGTNMWVGKNNTWYDSSGGTTGNPSTGANPTIILNGNTTYVPYIHLYVNTARLNFGQGGQSGLTYYPNAGGYFKYAPPTGFKALSTKNLPEPTIKKPNQHFDVALYDGNASTKNITGLSFKPDLVWIKGRLTATYNNNILVDSVRGVGKILQSNQTVGEGTTPTSVTSFNTDGFSIGSFEDINTNLNKYVAWNWRAGGTAVTNTSGTITSQVSANPTAGFSIITWTGNNIAGATIGHGLNNAPKFIITKSINSGTVSDHWTIYHSSMDSTSPQNYAMHLNLTNARNSAVDYWNNTIPNSSVITHGYNSAYINVSGRNYVTYAWSEVPGFSKFGTYTGNGSADGPFVYTGFQPKWILVKRSDGVENWYVIDTARSPNNPAQNNTLFPNLSNAEANTVSAEDILSNGFKMRANGNEFNGAGMTYIYAAFAEFPFKYANAR